MLLNLLSKITQSPCDSNVTFQGTWSTYLSLIYSGFINYWTLLRQQLLPSLSRRCWHALWGRDLNPGLCSQGLTLDISLSGSCIVTEHTDLTTVRYVWCLMRHHNQIHRKVTSLMHSRAGTACKQHHHEVKGLQQLQITGMITVLLKLGCGNAKGLR